MLILSRKVDEAIFVGKPNTEGVMPICFRILDLRGGRVRIGITAPDGVEILREELIVTCQQCKRRVYPWDEGYKAGLCITHMK